ncbi:MAG: retention module-containing protein, partial [Hylemonella sp.]
MAKIATITSITGKAFAISADGKIRELKLGDEIEKGEIIQTAAGGRVELQMVDGQAFAVAPEQLIKLDENVALEQGEQRPTAKEGAVTPSTADEVIQALERGGDLTEQLEATAAGAGGGGGGQGNAGFVRLLRISEGTDPLAYEYAPPEFGEVVSITGDAAAELANVTVSVVAGIVGGGTGVITSGDIAGSVKTLSVVEGSSDQGTAVSFLITLDRPAPRDVTVTYTIKPGSATDAAGATTDNPADYSGGDITGTVTIPAGYVGFTVTEYIVADYRIESNETFYIVLSNPIGATIVNDTATVTIIDDDSAPTAQKDSNSVTEDTQITASGNLIRGEVGDGSGGGVGGADNDADGNDLDILSITSASGNAATSTNGDTEFTIVGKYGTLDIEKETGKYTYTLDHDKVDYLAVGEKLSDEIFTYTVADPGNNIAKADLTITIKGTN